MSQNLRKENIGRPPRVQKIGAGAQARVEAAERTTSVKYCIPPASLSAGAQTPGRPPPQMYAGDCSSAHEPRSLPLGTESRWEGRSRKEGLHQRIILTRGPILVLLDCVRVFILYAVKCFLVPHKPDDLLFETDELPVKPESVR